MSQDNKVLEIPVHRLEFFCNAYLDNPWSRDPISEEMVREFIEAGKLEPLPMVQGNRQTDNYDVGRIAYFVVYGWDDAISIDVGVPEMNCRVEWMVQDGNHRLAAAIYRKDESINAFVDGSIDESIRLFGVGHEIEGQPRIVGYSENSMKFVERCAQVIAA